MYRRSTRALWLGVTSFRKHSLPNTTTQRRIGTLRLLVFNTAVSGTLYVVGDVMQQKIFGSPYDYARTARMCALGLCVGPLNHFWYLQLDRLVVGEGMKMVMKKILCDQSIFAPTIIIVFYLGKLVDQKIEKSFIKYYLWGAATPVWSLQGWASLKEMNGPKVKEN